MKLDPGALSNISVPNLFRDIIALLGGVVLLIGLNLTSHPFLIETLRIRQLGNLENDFILLTFAFLGGKILILLADFILGLMLFVFDKEYQKSKFVSILKRREGRVKSISDMKGEANSVDVLIVKDSHRLVEGQFERNIYHGLYLKLIIALSFIFGTILYDWRLLALCVWGIELFFQTDREIGEFGMDIQENVLKNRNDGIRT